MLRHRLATRAILFLAVMSFVTAALLTYQVARQLEALRSSSHDNILWSLQRLENVSTQLLYAVDGREPVPSGAVMRKNFDIFYSRVDTIKNSPIFELIKSNKSINAKFNELKDITNTLAPIFDRTETEIYEQLPYIFTQIQKAQNNTVQIALAGLETVTQDTEDKRQQLYRTLRNLGLVCLALVSMLSVFGIYIYTREKEARNIAVTRKEAVATLKTIIDTSLDAIITIDHRGKTRGFNPAAERIFGYSERYMLGKNIAEYIIPEKYRIHHQNALAYAHDTGQFRISGKGKFHMQALRSNGKEFPIEMAIERLSGKQPSEFVAFIRDITKPHKKPVQLQHNIIAPNVVATAQRGLSDMVLRALTFSKSHSDVSRELLQKAIENSITDMALIAQNCANNAGNAITTFDLHIFLQETALQILLYDAERAQIKTPDFSALNSAKMVGNRPVLRAIFSIILEQVTKKLPAPFMTLEAKKLAGLDKNQLVEISLIIEENAVNRHRVLHKSFMESDAAAEQNEDQGAVIYLVELLGANFTLKQISQSQSALILTVPLTKAS